MGILKVQPAFLFIALLIGMTYTTAQSQTHNKFATAGTIELGGNLSYDAIYKSSSFSVSPYIGWFPIDGLEIGFDPIEYSALTDHWLNFNHGYVNSQISILIMLAPSYNFKLTGKSFLFVEGLIGYTHQYQNGYYDSPTGAGGGSYANSDSGIAYGGHIGVKVAISDHGLFNIGVQYLRTVYPIFSDMTYGYNDISLVAGFTVVL
jgi:hypothetical protein